MSVANYHNIESPNSSDTRYLHGEIPIKGALLELMQLLDQVFLKLAFQYNAVDHKYSSFIHGRELKKIDYLHSFPQHVTFPVNLDDDKSNLDAFVSMGNAVDDHNCINMTKLSQVSNILTPAACYHAYIDYQDSQLDDRLLITTKNTCFRREKYYSPLQRQWSFCMREIICIGGEEHITSFLNSMVQDLNNVFKLINLPIEWCTATDPFFDPDQNAKYLSQKLAPNKWEMTYSDRLAIGSRNNHRNYFGEKFNISFADEPAFSACVAFGLERWLFAFKDYFGDNKANWPIKQLESLL